MTTKDVVLLVLGAIAGAIASGWYTSVTNRVSSARMYRRKQMRRARGLKGSVRSYLLQYYQRRGSEHELYLTQYFQTPIRIPLLVDPSATFSEAISSTEEEIVRLDEKFQELPVDNQLINRARRRGARLFDGEILYVRDTLRESNGKLSFTVGRCNYFAYATLAHQIEREAGSRFRRRHLHDRHLQSFNSALSSGLTPQALGCSVVTLFEGNDNEVYTAIAMRSSDVFMAHDTRGVVPNFGVEANRMGRQQSRFGIFFYNYVKEFVEEYYDLEEVVHAVGSRRAHPDWISNLPQAAAVIDEAVGGRLKMKCLGLAVNPMDASLGFALVAHFQSSSFFEQLRREAKVNWEFAGEDRGSPPVQFVQLFDPVLDDWVRLETMDPSSTYAIDLARHYVATLP